MLSDKFLVSSSVTSRLPAIFKEPPLCAFALDAAEPIFIPPAISSSSTLSVELIMVEIGVPVKSGRSIGFFDFNTGKTSSQWYSLFGCSNAEIKNTIDSVIIATNKIWLAYGICNNLNNAPRITMDAPQLYRKFNTRFPLSLERNISSLFLYLLYFPIVVLLS